MSYLRIRLNKTQPRHVSQPKTNADERVVGAFVIRWSNGYWRLWNWQRSRYEEGLFPTREKANAAATALD